MKLRSIVWTLPLFVVGPVPPPVDEPMPAIEVAEPRWAGAASLPAVPGESRSEVGLALVRWTAPRRESVDDLADRWGMKASGLRALNPELAGVEDVEPDTRWVVYRDDVGEVSRSIGPPNRGRLEHGVPMPEGPHWELRRFRPRTYATERVIGSMMIAFDAFGRRFPDAPPVLVGELSNRRGGRARPHSSHRSGRDLDLGYVLRSPAPTAGRWTRATEENLDVEKTWTLVEALLATGEVERIFMSQRVQRWLADHAAAKLSPEDMTRIFAVANETRRGKAHAVIGYWEGHEDHMHVRFACSPADLRCEEQPRRRKKKSKRKRKR